jgi:hypothetical protein
VQRGGRVFQFKRIFMTLLQNRALRQVAKDVPMRLSKTDDIATHAIAVPAGMHTVILIEFTHTIRV